MKGLALLLALHAAAMAVTATLATTAGAPFTIWFPDTSLLIGGLLGALLLSALVWDGSLLAAGVAVDSLQGFASKRKATPRAVETVRRIRFFNCGPLPIPVLVTTWFAMLGTSNVTLLSLQILTQSHSIQWRDKFFWDIESPILSRLHEVHVDVALWDRLYHSVWGIEFFAAFALVIAARGPRVVRNYGATMIILFYLGRLAGLLNPVMGPAFYRPDLFQYLQGSLTATTMKLVASIMAEDPRRAMSSGGLLLGGVSAMPSLHVAMVAATAYWLAAARRWTMIVTVPWVLCVWAATVLLGWHYILDGAGGIVLAAASIALTRYLVRRLDLDAEHAYPLRELSQLASRPAPRGAPARNSTR